MIKAILMDFNGVIIDDEPIQHAAYKEIFSADGVDVTDEMYYSRLGMDDKTFVASILEEAGKPSDMDRVLELTSARPSSRRDTSISAFRCHVRPKPCRRALSPEQRIGRKDAGLVLPRRHPSAVDLHANDSRQCGRR